MRLLVAEVTELKIDRMPGGAIIRATGIPRSQGYWDASLVPAPQPGDAADTLSFEFRVFPPIQARRGGTAPPRDVVVAYHVTNKKLKGIRRIVVIGQSNRLSSRR